MINKKPVIDGNTLRQLSSQIYVPDNLTNAALFPVKK
jgi:hypothetical protein